MPRMPRRYRDEVAGTLSGRFNLDDRPLPLTKPTLPTSTSLQPLIALCPALALPKTVPPGASQKFST